MIKVLVLDAEQGRIPLNVVRSLGREGIELHVAGSLNISTPFYSRYCKKKIVYPSVSLKPLKFKQFIFSLLKKEKYDIVFPLMNDTVMFFSKYKDEISKHTFVPLVNYDKMKLAMNKEETIRLAQSLGIPCPATYYPENIKELREIIDNLKYPIVLKSRYGFGSRGVRICKSRKEAIWNYKLLSKEYGSPMVQEFIPPGGDAIGVSFIFNGNNESKAVFTHKRLREFPISGGPSTLRESINHPLAESAALKLLKNIGWYGLAMVEFKVDPRDNVPKLMEINPRFWGSISLPIKAGVNFPLLLFQLSQRGDVDAPPPHKIGLKSRWLGGDFLYLLNAPSKLKFLPTFLNFADKNTFCEDFSKDDPLPPISRVFSLVYMFDKRVRRFIFRKY